MARFRITIAAARLLRVAFETPTPASSDDTTGVGFVFRSSIARPTLTSAAMK